MSSLHASPSTLWCVVCGHSSQFMRKQRGLGLWHPWVLPTCFEGQIQQPSLESVRSPEGWGSSSAGRKILGWRQGLPQLDGRKLLAPLTRNPGQAPPIPPQPGESAPNVRSRWPREPGGETKTELPGSVYLLAVPASPPPLILHSLPWRTSPY